MIKIISLKYDVCWFVGGIEDFWIKEFLIKLIVCVFKEFVKMVNKLYVKLYIILFK